MCILFLRGFPPITTLRKRLAAERRTATVLQPTRDDNTGHPLSNNGSQSNAGAVSRTACQATNRKDFLAVLVTCWTENCRWISASMSDDFYRRLKTGPFFLHLWNYILIQHFPPITKGNVHWQLIGQRREESPFNLGSLDMQNVRWMYSLLHQTFCTLNQPKLQS